MGVDGLDDDDDDLCRRLFAPRERLGLRFESDELEEPLSRRDLLERDPDLALGLRD